jgi:hypothetical protein
VPLAGELQPFALPGLLQRIADARASGTLALLPAEGAPAQVGFAAGRPVNARWVQRSGRDAFFQLFLRPITGRFTFEQSVHQASAPPLGEVSALVRDAIRRGRQMRKALALVPGELPLEATGSAPGTVDDEPDYELVVTLWQRACGGTTADGLEAELTVDSSRILVPLAQWLKEGALRVVEPAEAGPEAQPASQRDPAPAS